MRSVGLALLASVTLLGGAPADASDRDVLRQFGMLGKLAVDCAAPASGTNPHLFFAVSREGKATRTLKTADPDLDATLSIRNVRLIAPDRLQYDETGRQSELVITIAKIGGKFRSWHSVRADGTVLVADGKFPSSGSPTIAFTACRN
jgi:hypothetical protein